jgi:hypothetical protein
MKENLKETKDCNMDMMKYYDGDKFGLWLISVSSRISKGHGYQGFLRKGTGSSFCQKRAICVVQGKT